MGLQTDIERLREYVETLQCLEDQPGGLSEKEENNLADAMTVLHNWTEFLADQTYD